VFPEDNAQNSH